MADSRVQFSMRIVDGTTSTQEAAVSAGGALSVDSELPAAGALADNASNPTTPLVGACLLGFDGSAWDRIYTIADGDTVAAGTKGFLVFGTDGTNYQALAVNADGEVGIHDGGNSVTVDGTVAISGTVTVDSELPAAGALADNASNPTTPLIGACLLGYDGSTWDRIYTIADGDAVAAGTKGFLMFGTDGSNYQALAVSSGGAISVSIDVPSSPTIIYTTKSALAAGSASTTEHRTSELGGTTKKLSGIDASSSVAIKVVVNEVNDGTPTTKAVLFSAPDSPISWRPPHKEYFSKAFIANAGFDGWETLVTNLDTSDAADTYVTFYYES